MEQTGKHTFNEILSQPDIWAEIIDLVREPIEKISHEWAERPKKTVIFTGCGSSYYAALSAAAAFQYLGKIPTFAFPASELLLFPHRAYFQEKNILLIAISRSGDTTETVKALSAFKTNNMGTAVAITCDSESNLAKEADHFIGLNPAQEVSVAQTRSLTSMLLSSLILSQKLSDHPDVSWNHLPKVCANLQEQYISLAKKTGEDLQYNRYFILGSGFLFGVANEAMLKMKEMSLTYSEAFHSLEFRHGPMSMVNNETIVVGMVSESAQKQETKLLKDMRDLGAKVISITESPSEVLEAIGDVIILNSGIPEWARLPAYLPVLQLMSYYRSIAKGLDPDNPENLSAVIKIDSLK